MRKQHSFDSKDELQLFIKKALYFADQSSDCFCLLNGNKYDNIIQGSFPFVLAIGAKDKIEWKGNLNEVHKALSQKKELYGILSYDLKNDLEPSLYSKNKDKLFSPELAFFEPKIKISFNDNELVIETDEPENIYDDIEKTELPNTSTYNGEITQVLSKDSYIKSVDGLKKHIKSGDIYEVNFCMEFIANNINLDPISSYFALNESSSSPFSGLFKWNEHYLISASPERFIKKVDKKLIAQPIKGTRKRSIDKMEDETLKAELKNDPKERAENVMIVDLVRNDLTPYAVTGSVKVDELFGIYSFPQVHQMISSISAELTSTDDAVKALFNAFPMGSMTGAPKLKAMELIEKYEVSKRGWYSGALGYIETNGDFDFNVVIRSIVFNKKRKIVSYQAGSAITYDALPEFEYDECLLKADALRKALRIK